MTPFERAAAVYQTEPCECTLQQDLMHHLLHGFVFSTPDYFIMGRAVNSKAPHALIVNPSHRFQLEECDCWHVYLFAGAMERAWDILPYELPMFSLERKNELRFYSFAAIARHVDPAQV